MAGPLETLQHHVSGAIERGEKTAVAGIPDQSAFYEHAKATTAALANGPVTLTGMVEIVKGLAQLWEIDHGVTLDFSAMSLAKACHMGLPDEFRA